jgi:hypothetical protein
VFCDCVPTSSSAYLWSSLPWFFSAPPELLQVLPHESDAAAAASCKQAVGNLLLCLLLHLTSSWPPLPLADFAAEVLSASPTASLLPSPASVLAPVPLVRPGQQAATPAGAAPSGAAATAASSSAAVGPGQDSRGQSNSSTASDAAGVVCSLLGLLQETGLGSWQSLAGESGDEAAGAALAALYARCLDVNGPEGHALLAMPESAVETLQVSAHICLHACSAVSFKGVCLLAATA